MNSVSIVIPTHNMADHLRRLWDSILQSETIDVVSEVLIVDDGSTDHTLDTINEIKQSSPRGNQLQVLSLKNNQGRFFARYAGALEVKTSRVLFLDSRVQLQEGFGAALSLACQRQQQDSMGQVDIDITQSIYHLYWDRSHRFFFRKFFREAKEGTIRISQANFDDYPKGTGVLLVHRETFLKICEHYKDQDLKSDDTLLMKEMVKVHPLISDPKLRILWEPRETASEFLKRLWERGEGFAEYHIFENRGLLFWLVCCGVLFILVWLALVFTKPIWALWALAGAFAALGLSSTLFARTPWEWIRIAPLHIAVIVVYGFGALRGLFLVGRKRLAQRQQALRQTEK